LLASATGASAQDPSGDSAVDQYSEQVPTGSGGKSPTAEQETVKSLPTPVTEAIEEQGGSAAPVLKRVATSSKYGAPSRELTDREAAGLLPDSNLPEPPPESTLAAAASTLSEGSTGRLGGLFLALLLIATIAVVASVQRQKRSRA
jgi:hypothetical protein